MVLGNEISLICGRNFIVVESFSGQLSGTDGCNGILLLETAVGVVGIIALPVLNSPKLITNRLVKSRRKLEIHLRNDKQKRKYQC